MICTKVKTLKLASLILCAVVLSLAAFRPTMAKSRAYSAAREVTTTRNYSGATVNAKAKKSALLRIISSKVKTNPKFAKALSAACNCAVGPELATGYTSCFKQCLADAGVSWVTIASCGAICSNNLIGCAICAGVQEWIVLACAQICAWRKVFNYASTRPSKNRRWPQTNLSPPQLALAT